jgi:hypothetical protein
MYENHIMKPVEIVLRSGGGGGMNRKNRRGEFVQGILHAYVKVSH